jgi:hypothetical protein
MNTPETDKNIAIYNNQSLDSFSDTIISFEYARYNLQQLPTGGFAVVFFDSIIDMPRDGGPGQSLGYTSSSRSSDSCRLNGYGGIQGAILGIGFDSSGRFALATDMVDGIALSALKPQPSIIVRDGIQNNFNLLYNLSDSKNIVDVPGLETFTIDQQVSAIDDDSYRSVRIIVSKQFEDVRVQLKQNPREKNFIDVLRIARPSMSRKTFKVALTNTSDDNTTKFLIRNFNIAGFPGVARSLDLIPTCNQIIELDNHSPSSKLGMGQEFIAVPVSRKLQNYTTDLNRYSLQNTIYTGAGVTLLGQDDTTMVGRLNGTSNAVILQYLGQKLARVNTISTPDNSPPVSADIDGNTLVICTQANEDTGTVGGIFIYNYIETSSNPALVDTWGLYQTILPSLVLSGIGLGISTQLYGDNLIIGNSNQYVHAFQRDATSTWNYLQTIFSPVSGISRFGYTTSLYGRDLMVGASVAQKPSFFNVGQGEVYHYYLSSTTNNWNKIMGLGEFYNINSIAGNFGTDIAVNNKICVVGAPGEAYLEPGGTYEAVNVGRVYVFRRSDDGIFTQATTITPASGFREKYMFFGQSVNAYDNFVSVVASYTPKYTKSYLCVYNTDCLFNTPPAHLAIPDCAISIIDQSGYVIDLENNTYMLNLSCLLNP